MRRRAGRLDVIAPKRNGDLMSADEVGAPSGVGVVYDESMLRHRGPEGHPERPERLLAMLRSRLLDRCRRLVPTPADDAALLRVHTAGHVEAVGAASRAAEAEPSSRAATMPHGDGAIYYHAHTDRSARMAAGCVLRATDAVIRREVRSAFALVRPPGHHAEANEAIGFCFYNSAAVAAAHALAAGVPRVAIVDWDVHHGNGTQHIFEVSDRWPCACCCYGPVASALLFHM